MISPRLPRRSVLLGILAAPFTVTACSDGEPQAAPSSSTTVTPSATPTKGPTVTGKGLPKDLLAVMTAVYLGGRVPAPGAVGTALATRKPRAKSVPVTGTLGKWKGAPIAVVVTGKDVTLLVKAKGWTVVGGWWPSLGVKRPPFKAMRILAIGSDARPTQTVTKQRADAIQVVGVDSAAVRAIVGIPRDSWVNVANGGTNKLNSALVFGGVEGMVRTVERSTGIPIDGYVITGFKGFRAMVNAMGGIRFVAKAALRAGNGTLLLKKGANVLKGEPALNVARERKGLSNGDFGRSANQGRLILAGMATARAKGAVALPKYLTAMSAWIQTDLSAAQVLNLAATTYLTNPSAVTHRVAAGGVGTRDGQSVVLLGGSARSLFKDMKNGRLGA